MGRGSRGLGDTRAGGVLGEWCAPYHKLSPILEEIAEEKAGRLKVLKLDTEENPELVVAHGVRAAPTLALSYSGLERWRMVGFRPKSRLEAELEEVMAELSA